MQADEYYILVVSVYCLIIGFVVPRFLFRLKFLPIGYLVMGGVSAIAGFFSHLLIYGADNLVQNPAIGMVWSTIICLGITSVIYIRKKYVKDIPLKIIRSSYETTDIQEIKALISNNEIEKACEKLIDLTKSDHRKNDELLLIKRKIQKIKSENRMGVLANEDMDIGYSRISFSLLEITNSL